MEEFVTTSRFEDHMRESDSRYRDLVRDVKDLSMVLENKVPYSTFTWTLGILITILIVVFGFITTQIKDVQVNTASINTNVTKIQGKLDPYNFEIKP